MRVQSFRDLSCISLCRDQWLVLACDSVGGIGQMPQDSYRANPEVVGHFALRVPLMEIMASGADPILVADTLMTKNDPYSQAILAGMKDLVLNLRLDHEVLFNGSTEDNVVTVQTGVGVTVLGTATTEQLQLGVAQKGQLLVVAGLPKSAPNDQIVIGDPEVLSLQDLQALRRLAGVSDIVPVGSRGIQYEAHQLAKSAGLACSFQETVLPLETSAGPSTCVVFACTDEGLQNACKAITAPVHVIGRLSMIQ